MFHAQCKVMRHAKALLCLTVSNNGFIIADVLSIDRQAAWCFFIFFWKMISTLSISLRPRCAQQRPDLHTCVAFARIL